MARMIGPMFMDSPLLAIPLTVLLLFVGVFAAITVRALAKPSAAHAAMAQLPLDADDEDADG